MNIFQLKRFLFCNENGDGQSGGSMGGPGDGPSGDGPGDGRGAKGNDRDGDAGGFADGRGAKGNDADGDAGSIGNQTDANQSQAETNRLSAQNMGELGLANISPGVTDLNAFGQMMDKIPTAALAKMGLPGMALGLASAMGLGMKGSSVAGSAAGLGDGSGRGGAGGTGGGGDRGIAAASPFGGEAPAQTTPAPGSTGARSYVWDPATRSYTLANLGEQSNPMGYTQGQRFDMGGGQPSAGLNAADLSLMMGNMHGGFASGGEVGGLAHAAPTQSRFINGPGDGLSDDVKVKMDDGAEGRLADGEFVLSADVVSGLGNGSSAAGAKILYAMVERIRKMAHGKTQQTKPVDPQQVLPA